MSRASDSRKEIILVSTYDDNNNIYLAPDPASRSLSNFFVPVNNLAAAFCILCSFEILDEADHRREHYNNPGMIIVKYHTKVTG